MLKLIVVDDEAKTRRGIKTLIDWQSNGILFAGDAMNGVQALEMVRTEKPDIVIADIRMPLMDGLEFAGNAKKENRDIKIIFLSGYDDFSYAQAACKIGVSDYLLKPFGVKELTVVVCRIRDQIYEERKQRNKGKSDEIKNNQNHFENYYTLKHHNGSEKDSRRILSFSEEHELGELLCRFAINQALTKLHSLFEKADNTEDVTEDFRDLGRRLIDLAYFTFIRTGVDGGNYEPAVYKAYQQIEQAKTLYEIEMVLSSQFKHVVSTVKKNIGHQHSAICAAAMNYIERNSKKNLNLQTVAKTVGVSPNYLCRVFKLELGRTFKEWHHLCRIERAKQYLRSPDARVYEIADKTGYSDYKYFSRIFKRVTGLTPKEYQKISAENN